MTIRGVDGYSYVPYDEICNEPNLVVAGSRQQSTVRVISPFQPFGLDDHLLSETSAQIVANLMEAAQPTSAPMPVVLTSNEFSIDGLCGIFALLKSKDADAATLQDIARTALYQWGSNQDVARVVFVLNAWMDQQRSPFNQEIFDLPTAQRANVFYEELIPRFLRIIERIERFHGMWQAEEELVERTESLLDDGSITVAEVDDLDLAVFNIDARVFEENGELHISTEPWHCRPHRLALHNKTSCTRILLQKEKQYFFYCRPDTLALCYRQLLPERPNLSVLAQNLNQLEQDGDGWTAQPTDNLWASVANKEDWQSSLDLSAILQALRNVPLWQRPN